MLQGLYNPDRLRSPLLRNDLGRLEPLGWDEAQKTLADKIEAVRKNGSGKIVFLSDHVEGTLGNLIDDWMTALGENTSHTKSTRTSRLKKRTA